MAVGQVGHQARWIRWCCGSGGRRSCPGCSAPSTLSRVVNAQGPPNLVAEGRALLVVRGAPVLMVGTDPDRVELALVAGELACPRPGCGGVLGPWGWGRGRWLRGRGGVQQRVCPRRGRCRERACRATHVLLPTVGLLRRVDVAEVIGAALLARARQVSLRQIAVELGVPLSTV